MKGGVWSTNLIIVMTTVIPLLIAASLDMPPASYHYIEGGGIGLILVFLVFGFPVTLGSLIALALFVSWIKSRLIGVLKSDTATKTFNWQWYYALLEGVALLVSMFVGAMIEDRAKVEFGAVHLLLFWLALIVPINGLILKFTSVIGDREPAVYKRFFLIVGFSMITPATPLTILGVSWLFITIADRFV